jgi:hypothetical protein
MYVHQAKPANPERTIMSCSLMGSLRESPASRACAWPSVTGWPDPRPAGEAPYYGVSSLAAGTT